MNLQWQWTLALRHLRGRYSRPALRWINRFAFLGLVMGVVAWITVMSVMDGLQDDIKTKILREKPHILWEDRPTAGLGERIASGVQDLGIEVRMTRWVLQTEGLLERETRQDVNPGSAVIIQGVDGLAAGEARAGVELAAVLGLQVGEFLLLRSAWDLERSPLKLRFDESFDSGVYDIDRHVVRVPRLELGEWLRIEDAVSRIEIFLEDPFEVDQVREELVKKTGLAFKTWKELESALLYSLNLERNVMAFAVFIIILLSTLAVSMGMAVRVTEKRRVVGLLRALGADQNQIRGVFIRETLLLSLSAVSIGILLAFLFCSIIGQWAAIPAFYYGKGVPVSWSWTRALSLGVAVTVLALCAAWWPLRRGLKVEPAEILSS